MQIQPLSIKTNTLLNRKLKLNEWVVNVSHNTQEFTASKSHYKLKSLATTRGPRFEFLAAS